MHPYYWDIKLIVNENEILSIWINKYIIWHVHHNVSTLLCYYVQIGDRIASIGV